MATEFSKKSQLLGITIISLYLLTQFILGFKFFTFLWILFGGLVAFGIYSMAMVGKMASSFNSCIEAKNELLAEIDEANEYLKPLGFKGSKVRVD